MDDLIKSLKLNTLFLLLVALIVPLLFLCGCGGNGSPTAIPPQKQEFADVLTSFVTAVSNKDKIAAISLIDSRLVYNNSGTYSDFKNRLGEFIDKYSSIKLVINSEIGVSFLDDREESAELLADVEVTYDSKVLRERIQLEVRKTSSLLGITRFQKYSREISAFPPK